MQLKGAPPHPAAGLSAAPSATPWHLACGPQPLATSRATVSAVATSMTAHPLSARPSLSSFLSGVGRRDGWRLCSVSGLGSGVSHGSECNRGRAVPSAPLWHQIQSPLQRRLCGANEEAAATAAAAAAAVGPLATGGRPQPPNDLSTLKVADLQAALQALGLPRSGRKADLVDRLAAAAAATVGPSGDGGAGATAASGGRSNGTPAPPAKPAAPAAAAKPHGSPAGRGGVRRGRDAAASVPDDGDGGVGRGAGAAPRGRDAAAAAPSAAAGAAAPPRRAAQNPGRAGRATEATAARPGAAGRAAGAAREDGDEDEGGTEAAEAGRPTGGFTAAAFAPAAGLRRRGSLVPRSDAAAAEAAAPATPRGAGGRAGSGGGGASGGDEATADAPAPTRRILTARRIPSGEPEAVSRARGVPPGPSPRQGGKPPSPRREGARPAEPTAASLPARKADAAASSSSSAAASAPARRAPPAEAAPRAASAAPVPASAAASASTAEGAPVPGSPPDMQNLPPWPKMYMGRPQRLIDMVPHDRDKQDLALATNVPGLLLTSLGSAAGYASAGRGLGSLAMSRGKDIFMFDVGDDTQRQVGQLPHVRPAKVYRIFLTSLAPECVLGLPGLMCTVNASRERGHEAADIPVHVYGPPGTADFLASVMRVSQTYLDITIVVHEVSTDPVPEDQAQPCLYAVKAKIWRVLMPPDQLNPRGAVDASLLNFAPSQGRGQKKKGRNAAGGVLSYDPRAGYQPWPPLVPGDPDRRGLPPLELCWTLDLEIGTRVYINLLPAAGGATVLAYTVQEADRAGALVLERALAAGLEEGAHLGKLKEGQTLNNRFGQPVPPELVITPVRPGRRVVVLGDTTDPSPLQAHPHTRGADVLVAGAVWSQGDAEDAEAGSREPLGCSAAALGETAARLGVRYVMLARFDGRRLAELEAADDASGGAAGASGGAGGGGRVKAYTDSVAAEVAAAAARTAAAAAAAAGKRRGGGVSARFAARSGGGGGGGGGGEVGGSSVRDGRTGILGVMVLDSLENVFVDRNEGPTEPPEA